MKPLYRTKTGVLYLGEAEDLPRARSFKSLKGKVNLIFTSPPFPLIRRKAYGNLDGRDYVDWLASFSDIFRDMLRPDGSIVMEIGNAWEPGTPEMSVLSLEALLEFKRKGDFHLCQQFIWNNTTRLPSPAQWVNVERIRVKDSFTNLWWFSTTPKPKADNRAVLQKYSKSMKSLLGRKEYNPGKRPSEHQVGAKSFLTDNTGSIPSNVLSIPNTISNDPYLRFCRENDVDCHPARMPPGLAEFFILLLTDGDDIVLDPFAGSNVTGWVAEKLDRRWRSIEREEVYAVASKSRFRQSWFASKQMREKYDNTSSMGGGRWTRPRPPLV
ncbi:MAG: DNA-methyltransferase [Candidatus Thorarchaeota archaeon]|jgi:site-specific DNA-methyltransferase (cytosine-N4-specific)